MHFYASGIICVKISLSSVFLKIMNLYIFVLTDACSGPQHYLSVANDKIKSSQILVVYEMET